MFKKILAAFFAVAATTAFAFGLSACDNNGGQLSEGKWGEEYSLSAAYAEARELGYAGTLEEFIAMISGKDGADGAKGDKGDKGDPGADGADGIGVKSATINDKGELVITLSDGSIINVGKVVGADGADGDKGDKGDKGDPGKDGQNGSDGKDGLNGSDGKDGLDGVGVKTVYINEGGMLVVVLTDGKEIECELPSCAHKYGEWSALAPATCLSIGLNVRTCALCGDMQYNVVPATGHTAGDDLSFNRTAHSFYCRTCGQFVNEKHTRDEDGVCTVCGSTGDYSVGLTFSLNEDGASYSVSSMGSCTDTEVSIPNTYNGLPVTEIDGSAFQYQTSLKSLIIPENVEVIWERSLEGCGNLTDIYINSRTLKVGEDMNRLLQGRTNLHLGATVESFDFGYFMGNSNVVSITVDDQNPTYYAQNNIIYSRDKTIIYGYFSTDTQFDPQILEGVKVIGDYAFKSTGFTEVKIPEGVTKIGAYAFQYCYYLVDISLPQSLITIGDFAFGDCISLEDIVVPDSVQTIGIGLFSGCSSLKSATLPAGLTEIPERTFYCCVALESFVIPEGITKVGGLAFYQCCALKEINIPDTVQSIGEELFYECSSLERVKLPAELKQIPDDAFAGCISLENITIPDSVIVIGKYAFGGTSLTGIDLPENLMYIGWKAFDRTFDSIIIPSSVESMEEDALYSLSVVYYEGTEEEWNERGFYNVVGNDSGTAAVYFYSESQPQGEGNYWRYVDGLPAVWGGEGEQQ